MAQFGTCRRGPSAPFPRISVTFSVFSTPAAFPEPRYSPPVSIHRGLGGGSSRSQAEHAHGVLLEDERADLGLEIKGFEVAQPAVGGDDREVGSEEDLVP